MEHTTIDEAAALAIVVAKTNFQTQNHATKTDMKRAEERAKEQKAHYGEEYYKKLEALYGDPNGPHTETLADFIERIAETNFQIDQYGESFYEITRALEKTAKQIEEIAERINSLQEYNPVEFFNTWRKDIEWAFKVCSSSQVFEAASWFFVIDSNGINRFAEAFNQYMDAWDALHEAATKRFPRSAVRIAAWGRRFDQFASRCEQNRDVRRIPEEARIDRNSSLYSEWKALSEELAVIGVEIYGNAFAVRGDENVKAVKEDTGVIRDEIMAWQNYMNRLLKWIEDGKKGRPPKADKLAFPVGDKIFNLWNTFKGGEADVNNCDGQPRKPGGKRNYEEFLQTYGDKKVVGKKTLREIVCTSSGKIDEKALKKIIDTARKRKNRRLEKVGGEKAKKGKTDISN